MSFSKFIAIGKLHEMKEVQLNIIGLFSSAKLFYRRAWDLSLYTILLFRWQWYRDTNIGTGSPWIRWL